MAIMRRYKERRKNINWKKDLVVICLREICPLVAQDVDRDTTISKRQWIDQRIREMIPKVTKTVIGTSFSMKHIRDHVRRTQGGREFNLNSLVQRADKLIRYGEFGPMRAMINSAYEQASGRIQNVREDFEDWMEERRLKEVNGRCEYRGCDLNLVGYVLDHRVPIKKGGRGNYENLAICCGPCNSSKGTMDVAEFFLKIEKERERARKL